MNQRLELAIEASINERPYKVCLPFGAPYEDAFKVVDAFRVQLQTMQSIAMEQERAAQQQVTQEDSPK